MAKSPVRLKTFDNPLLAPAYNPQTNTWNDNTGNLTGNVSNSNGPKAKVSKIPKSGPQQSLETFPTDAQGWAEAPDYYNPDGSINPRYQSTRGQSAAAGARYGLSIRTGNPMFDAGALAGGIIGGLVHKDLAGQERYRQDQTAVDQQNETTMAHQRFLAQQELIQRQQQTAKIQQDKEARLAAATNERSLDKKLGVIKQNIQDTQGDERRYYQQQYAQLTNYPDPQNVDEDYMVQWKPYNTGGDVNYLVDGSGRTREALDKNGQSISRLGIKDLYTIAAQQNKLNPDNAVDQTSIDEAFKLADASLSPHAKDFVDSKGRRDAVQYNAQRMQLVNRILATKKANPNLQSTDMEVNFNGTPFTLSVPLVKAQVPAGTPTTPASPDPSVYDATVPPIPEDAYKLYQGLSNDAVNAAYSVTTPEQAQQVKSVTQKLIDEGNKSPLLTDRVKAMDIRANQLKSQPQNPQNPNPQNPQTPPDDDKMIMGEMNKVISHPAVQKAIGALKEGESQDFLKTINGKKRTITVTLQNGKPVITHVQ